MTIAQATSAPAKGGSFLFEDRAPGEVFTAEDLNEEHLAIARTVDQFWANEVEPHLEAIRQQKPGVALEVLRKSADLGLTLAQKNRNRDISPDWPKSSCWQPMP